MPPDLDASADLYAWYATLRRDEPVHYLPREEMWAVTRYDDVVSILRNPGSFSSASGMGDLLTGNIGAAGSRRPSPFSLRETGVRVLIATDPPDHTILRRLVSRAFTPRAVAALESRVRALTEGMVDDLLEAGEAGDVVAQLATPLPVVVIAELLGIPPERRVDFKRWSDDFVGGLSGTLDVSAAQRSGAELFSYFTEVVAERTARPGEDLISLLVTGGRDGESALGPVEIVLFCILLLVAGNETTTNLITNGVAALLDHPDAARRLREEPSLVPSAIEEVLRYDAPVQGLPRGTTRPVELGGTWLPEGARVLALFGSANRDEHHFHEADRFLVDRSPNDHLGFGAGIHLCVGAPLARLEARVVAETLFRRVRRLEPTAEAQRLESPILRGFARFPVHAMPA